jgi:chromosome partitioning protein
VLALAGVGDLMAVLETVRDRLDHDVRVAGVLATRVDRRSARVTDAVLAGLAETCGGLLLSTVIPVSSALARAQMDGVNVFDFDAASQGAVAYRALSGEILARLGVPSRAPEA